MRTCEGCGLPLTCVDCGRAERLLDQARRCLQTVSGGGSKFRGVPLEKFSYDELQKICKVVISDTRWL